MLGDVPRPSLLYTQRSCSATFGALLCRTHNAPAGSAMASSSRQQVPPDNSSKEETMRPREEEEKEEESADSTSEESSTRPNEESGQEQESSNKAAPESPEPVRSGGGEEEVKEPDADEDDGKATQPVTSSAPPSHSSKSHPPGPADSSKKPLLQRLWSKEDEISLLKGIIKYRERYNIDPICDMDNFFTYITRRIDLEVDRRQVLNKMRNCRTKFLNTEASTRSGKGRTITDPNEKLVRELSRTVWGAEDGVAGETSAPKAKKKKTGEKTAAAMVVCAENVGTRDLSLCSDMLSRFSNGCVDEKFVKRGLEMMSPKRREALEEECWELNMAELRALSKRARMVQEVTNRVIRAHEKSTR